MAPRLLLTFVVVLIYVLPSFPFLLPNSIERVDRSFGIGKKLLRQHFASNDLTSALRRQNMVSLHNLNDDNDNSCTSNIHQTTTTTTVKNNRLLLKRVWDRFDTIKSAKFDKSDNVQLQGWKTNLAIFGVLFFLRWYRAKYINKMGFWERQPQWNTVVTNKEQEDSLRAWTCKNCGSTIFIARHRNWMFEGDHGLSGLGCFTCGAKGKDNFVMDRDRIVEEVGEDDIFTYNQPLDFVTATERAKLIKEAGGDEEKANQMLRDNAPSEDSSDIKDENNPSDENLPGMLMEDAEIVEEEESIEGEEEKQSDSSMVSEEAPDAPVEEEEKEEEVIAQNVVVEEMAEPEAEPEVEPVPVALKDPPVKSTPPSSKRLKVPSSDVDDIDDLLGMDDF